MPGRPCGAANRTSPSWPRSQTWPRVAPSTSAAARAPTPSGWQRRGWRVTAIDVSTNALGRGRAAAEAAGVDVDWVASGLVELPERDGCFDLVTVFYPALMRTPHCVAETALLGAVAPAGTLLVVHHAEVDRAVAVSHGFDPDDYVGHDDIVAALGDGWVIEVREQRERDVTEGAGAHHHHDLVVRARRLPV